ncbi:MAG: hypothetical protein H7Z40_12785 [Phycisphaerae bacterium]|nr:hypothetical protein [Gemmatimonadaceae bacterium]
MSGSSQLLPEKSEHLFDRWTVLVLLAAGVGALGLIAVRLYEATIVGPLNYNEGWNAYHALRLQQTGSPYPPPGGLVVNNYTPLWFSLLSAAGILTDNLIFAGRFIATMGLWTMFALAAAIGHALRGSAGALAAFVAVLFVFASEANLYIGIADPQFVAQAAGAFALLLCVRARSATDVQYLAAMAVAVLAGFLKHNLAALPFALLVAALFERRATFLRVLLIAGVALAAGYLLSALVGGLAWPHQLLSARVYTLARLFRNGVPFVTANALGLFLAAVGLYTLPRGHVRRVLAIYLVTAVPLALFFVGGDGVAVNIFFDSMVIMAISASLIAGARGSIRRPGVAGTSAPQIPPWTGALTLAAFFAVIGFPQFLETGLRLRHPEEFDQRARAFQDDVRFLREQPGSAICYQPALCYLAGKPLVYDPFNADQALLTGAMSADQVRNILQRENVQVIHASGTTPDSRGVPAPLAAEVASEFSVIRENENGAFYVRRR